MNSEQFVKNCFNEKQKLLKEYFNKGSESLVAGKIKGLNLPINQREELKAILNESLTDVFYGILIGLCGSASIGDEQIEYKIFDEADNELDEIEEHAWSYFHENPE